MSCASSPDPLAQEKRKHTIFSQGWGGCFHGIFDRAATMCRLSPQTIFSPKLVFLRVGLWQPPPVSREGRNCLFQEAPRREGGHKVQCSVDPRSAAGLPFSVPESLEFELKHFAIREDFPEPFLGFSRSLDGSIRTNRFADSRDSRESPEGSQTESPSLRSAFRGTKIVNRGFEVIRANRSKVRKKGFFLRINFTQVKSCESARFALRIAPAI